jgi:hypothetical protein
MLGILKFQRDIQASSFGLKSGGHCFFSNSMLHVFSQHVVNTKSEKNVNRQKIWRCSKGTLEVLLWFFVL